MIGQKPVSFYHRATLPYASFVIILISLRTMALLGIGKLSETCSRCPV